MWEGQSWAGGVGGGWNRVGLGVREGGGGLELGPGDEINEA